MANLNINQFQQVPVRGEQDLQISRTGALSVVISANQATALKAGDYVFIDSAVTTGGNFPHVKAAATSDVGLIMALIHDVKTDSFAAGTVCQAVPLISGPVVFQVAAATIAPGAQVEDVGDGTVQTKSSGKLRGYAIDPGVTGQLLRIIGYSQLS